MTGLVYNCCMQPQLETKAGQVEAEAETGGLAQILKQELRVWIAQCEGKTDLGRRIIHI